MTQSWKEVKRIKQLYLYPKIRKHESAEAANLYVKNYGYKEAIKLIRNYGNTIKGFTLHAKYKIAPEALYLFYDSRDIGEILIEENQGLGAVVERTGYVTKMKIESLKLDNTLLKDHQRAVQTLLDIAGNNFCINVHIQYFGVYYDLTGFPRSSDSASVRELTSTVGLAWSYGDYQEDTQNV